MRNKLLLLGVLLLSLANISQAEQGISLGRGFNGIDSMNGFSANIEHFWGNITNFNKTVELTGYWNFGLSYWHSNSAKNTQYGNLTIFNIMPVFRVQRRFAYDNGISPFVDLGYGIGLMNRDQFSGQKLGGYGTFEQTSGVGINFGPQSQYDLSYHYLVYNNAAQFSNDDGLFVNEITFTYHMAD
jgi:hypothetical protein